MFLEADIVEATRVGNTTLLSKKLKENPRFPFLLDPFGETLLYHASHCGQVEAVEIIIRAVMPTNNGNDEKNNNNNNNNNTDDNNDKGKEANNKDNGKEEAKATLQKKGKSEKLPKGELRRLLAGNLRAYLNGTTSAKGVMDSFGFSLLRKEMNSNNNDSNQNNSNSEKNKEAKRKAKQNRKKKQQAAIACDPGASDDLQFSAKIVLHRLMTSSARADTDFHAVAKKSDLAGDDEKEQFLRAISHDACPLTSLDMRKCEMGPVFFAGFSDALIANPNIHTLYLYKNCCGDEGARLIGKVLSANDTVRKLNLCQNGVTAEGAKFLLDSLENSSLTALDINNNYVGDEGAALFAEAFASGKTGNLKTLSLRNNGITDRGALALAEALEKEKGKLEFLCLATNESKQAAFDVHYNEVSTEMESRVQAAVGKREKKKAFVLEKGAMGNLFAM